MLIKILGFLDLLAAFLLFALSFNLDIPKGVILFFVVILLLKGAFILTKSVASAFDLFGAVVLILAIYFTLPKAVFLIAAILIFQKGVLSLVS